MSDEAVEAVGPFRATASFKMHFDHLLCSFAKDDEIPEHVARYAMATGCPVVGYEPEPPTEAELALAAAEGAAETLALQLADVERELAALKDELEEIATAPVGPDLQETKEKLAALEAEYETEKAAWAEERDRLAKAAASRAAKPKED